MDQSFKAKKMLHGSILSLVQILFLLFLGMVMYANEFETKENNI